MKPILHLILAEFSLETVPVQFARTRPILKMAKDLGVKPEHIILDASLHRWILKKLPNSEKRGRPDVVHRAMLAATDSPVNKAGYLRFYVHTIQDFVIYVNPEVRLPRTYARFEGLMRQLFSMGKVPPRGEKVLLELKQQTYEELVEELKPDLVIGFSTKGTPIDMRDLARKLAECQKPCAVIGGFPHGHFSQDIASSFDEMYRVHREPLKAYVTVLWLLLEYERALGLYTP